MGEGVNMIRRGEGDIVVRQCDRCGGETAGYIGVRLPVQGRPVSEVKKLCKDCNRDLVMVVTKWWRG